MTMTIPQTFAGDTYLSSQKLQANFDYIKGIINGGISESDMSTTAGFTLAQTSENQSRFFVDVAFYQQGGAFAVQTVKVPILFNCELCDVSILAKKEAETTNDTEAYFTISNGSNVLATLTINEADDIDGYYAFSPRIGISTGFLYVNLTPGDIGNTEMATLRLGFVSKHTKRT